MLIGDTQRVHSEWHVLLRLEFEDCEKLHTTGMW